MQSKNSSICPRYSSEKTVRRYRLFKCLSYRLEANRDAVRVLNMATHLNGGLAIGLVAQPLLLRWDRCRWKGKSLMNTKGDEDLRSKNHPNFSWVNVKAEVS